ncbi:MAG TPA: LysR family transcriptional regulator substrate-binding protein, partial [Phormidium sp.]
IHYPQIVFKVGYGMQRLIQDHFQRLGVNLKAVLELNTLDAFRGMVRQGNAIALLPKTALFDAHYDPTLAVRPTSEPTLKRQVVLVTTCDRLQIPPIGHFRSLVHKLIGVDSANIIAGAASTNGKTPLSHAIAI